MIRAGGVFRFFRGRRSGEPKADFPEIIRPHRKIIPLCSIEPSRLCPNDDTSDLFKGDSGISKVCRITFQDAFCHICRSITGAQKDSVYQAVFSEEGVYLCFHLGRKSRTVEMEFDPA